MAAAAATPTFGRVKITADELSFLQAVLVAQGLYQTGQKLKGTIGMLLIEWKVVHDALQSTEKADEFRNHWGKYFSVNVSDERIQTMKEQLEEAITQIMSKEEGEQVSLDYNAGENVLLLQALARGGEAQYRALTIEDGGSKLRSRPFRFNPTGDAPKATKEIVLLHTSEDHVDLLVRIDAAGRAHGEWDITDETEAESEQRCRAVGLVAVANKLTLKAMTDVFVSDQTKEKMKKLLKEAKKAYNKHVAGAQLADSDEE
jgi:hypothetical protein